MLSSALCRFREQSTARETNAAPRVPEACKHQNPSTKTQGISKSQAPKSPAAVLLGDWLLELLWCLGIGVWCFSGDASLRQCPMISVYAPIHERDCQYNDGIPWFYSLLLVVRFSGRSSCRTGETTILTQFGHGCPQRSLRQPGASCFIRRDGGGSRWGGRRLVGLRVQRGFEQCERRCHDLSPFPDEDKQADAVKLCVRCVLLCKNCA